MEPRFIVQITRVSSFDSRSPVSLLTTQSCNMTVEASAWRARPAIASTQTAATAASKPGMSFVLTSFDCSECNSVPVEGQAQVAPDADPPLPAAMSCCRTRRRRLDIRARPL
jgi:hypothetical protein